MRAVGIIRDKNTIYLLRRVKKGKEYYCFPGGGVEKGETPKQAVQREINEEFGINPKKCVFLFEFENKGIVEHYFLMSKFEETPRLGGPEKERMNDNNQYYIEKFSINALVHLDNLYPSEVVSKIVDVWPQIR